MKTADIKAEIRENVGAGSAANARKNDKVPAVIYGVSGTQHVEVDYNTIAKLIHSPELFLINMNTGKGETRVIVQDTQYHPVTDRILHIDFLEAAVGKAAKLHIPIKLVGVSKGVLNGGQLVAKMRSLFVKGVPMDLPEAIEVDITEIEIGKSIKVADLEGFEFLDPANSVIVRVKAARSAEELAVLEEGAEEEAVEGEEGAEEGEPVAEGAEENKEASAEAPAE